MRHHNANRKFNRPRNQRTALMRSLACALIRHEKIETTEAKAKELRPYIEKLVTRGREDTLSNRRHIARVLVRPEAVKKLFAELGPRYKGRSGGYTRITKLTKPSSDGRSSACIEFV